MTTPAQATDEVLRRVEAATGKSVLVMADPSLKVIATSRAATADAPAHLVRHHPSAQAAADYITCFQCGFILRSAETEPADRFDVGPTFRGRKAVEQLLRDHGRQPGATPLAKEMREPVRDQLLDGVIRQLRSVPIGLRIDAWLLAEYPVLAEQQRAMAQQQLEQGLTTLSPTVRKLAPTTIVRASAAMSAAFAAFWGRTWGDPVQVSPYRAAGFLEPGEELLSVFDSMPADPSHDRELIERWAERLELDGWLEFLPLRG